MRKSGYTGWPFRLLPFLDLKRGCAPVGEANEEKLRFDREGQPRTVCSLRHTYICLRLMEGADIYQIAKNCRTSVEMIEKNYASHTLDAATIKVMRPKKRKSKEASLTDVA